MARITIEDLPKNYEVSDEEVKKVSGEDRQTEDPTTLAGPEHSGEGCGCGS